MTAEPNPPTETRTGQPAASSHEVVDALHAVVTDVEQFLTDWLGKVHDELAAVDPSSGNAALQKRWQGFQEEKKRWEAKRLRELDEIEQKANQITEAWLKLESEQRQLLKLQDKQRAPRRETPPPSHAVAEEPSQVAGEPVSGGPARRASNAIGANVHSAGGAMKTLNDAVRQFEQLRREIELTRAST